jgi:hypothetical protein
MRPAWTDRLFGNEKGPKPPAGWDAIRAAKDRLKVSINKKAGTISDSFRDLVRMMVDADLEALRVERSG